MKNIFRFLYVIIFVFIGVFIYFHPVKTETNLLRAVFDSSDELIVKLSQRYSSRINVIVEGENLDDVENAAGEILNRIDKKAFKIQEIDLQSFIETTSKSYKNLLSYDTYKKLKSKKYDEVTYEAYQRVFEPVNYSPIALNDDPFMLYNDYLKSLGDKSSERFLDGKYYKILSFNTDDSLTQADIKKLIQNEFIDPNVRVYLTGSPIHSYYASSKSILEINIICVLSILFTAFLCYFYFNSFKILVPIALTLALGILFGYFAVSVVFSSIHILTFVFSTTLIGICIDYSLHYFVEKDLSKILKSLTVSMVSTVSAFGVLLFSGIELLKQISVFTMAGLISVYLAVVLLYPLLNLEYKTRKINFSLPKIFKTIFALFFLVISCLGLISLRYNDDIRNMYVPSEKLFAAERLYSELNGKNISFAVVQGNDFQDMLKKEEWIAENIQGYEFAALSKFLPSENRQIENFRLRQELYKNSLKSFGQFLSKKDINKLLNDNSPSQFLDYNADLSEFIIDKNTSLMVLYDFDRPELIEMNGGKYINTADNVSEKIKECREICLKLLIPVFAVLFALLFAVYRNIEKSVKIIFPSIAAAIFSLALVSLTQPINLFHVLAIFLIIGFGLDYSVFRSEICSKDAVFLSCASSVFSFALLAFTSFKLISSLGFILSVGLAVSYIIGGEE